jgi:hypothetical protein
MLNEIKNLNSKGRAMFAIQILMTVVASCVFLMVLIAIWCGGIGG